MSQIKRESGSSKATAKEAKSTPAEQQSAPNAKLPQDGETASQPKPAEETSNPESTAAQEADPSAEITELKEHLLRTMADMDNLRKRTEREKAETAKYAISRFAQDILSVGDNIRRAIDAVPSDAIKTDAALKSLLEGVEMTEKELLSTFERHGIKRVDPRGELFDPNIHQAMFELENPDIAAGTIVEVVQSGYMISDRVLRPALVGIAKGGAKVPKPAPPETKEGADEEQTKRQPEPAGENPEVGSAEEKPVASQTKEKSARQP
ncbi:MAG: nucleotide exchange factor GrpE, partial [Methyloligellaceae bacterium]